jgi:hypothetical protein
MAQYLLVRDRDGAILGELVSDESVPRMLDTLGDIPLRGLSVVRVEDNPGAVIGTSSIVSMRSAGFDRLIARRDATKKGVRRSGLRA